MTLAKSSKGLGIFDVADGQQLLRTCPDIRAEATPAFYAEATFIFDLPIIPGMGKFFQKILEQVIAKGMRHLCLCVDMASVPLTTNSVHQTRAKDIEALNETVSKYKNLESHANSCLSCTLIIQERESDGCCCLARCEEVDVFHQVVRKAWFQALRAFTGHDKVIIKFQQSCQKSNWLWGEYYCRGKIQSLVRGELEASLGPGRLFEETWSRCIEFRPAQFQASQGMEEVEKKYRDVDDDKD